VIIAVPALTPVSVPLVASILATEVLPELHTPPPVALLNEVVLPIQTFAVPVIFEGLALTFSTALLTHPVDSDV
jgi:uncharacterized membrane protein